MAIYYQVVCDEAKEGIYPGFINNLGVKSGSIAHPEHPIGNILMFAMLYRWSGSTVRLANDLEEDLGFFEYEDVTEQVLAEYNKSYNTNIKFTG